MGKLDLTEFEKSLVDLQLEFDVTPKNKEYSILERLSGLSRL